MNADRILSDRFIHLKRGRMNQFGWEPAWNSYFDFYLNTKYFEKPLLDLEDVTLHLFLRKNLNDQNPEWRMPTIRQMMKQFKVGQHRLEAIINRLEAAHLLKKQSGLHAGPDGMTIRNDYILSDPIQTLEEFLAVASEGVFRYSLNVEPCSQNGYTDDDPIAVSATPGVAETAIDQQTSLQQTWDRILAALKSEMLSATFSIFLADTTLEIEGTTVMIRTPNTFAHSWIENRMSDKLLKRLRVELSQELTELHCVG